jgi:hypothetical protein
LINTDNKSTRYCIDTDSWINLPRNYPIKVFDGLWNNIELLINEGRIYSPREVFRELEKKDDEIHKWIKVRKSILIKNPDNDCLQIAYEIINKFNLVDPLSNKSYADPYVISLAVQQKRILNEVNVCVVSQETRAGGGAKQVKIPNVCDHYKIECLKLVDLFQRENWKF